jgi:hypothetical protein
MTQPHVLFAILVGLAGGTFLGKYVATTDARRQARGGEEECSRRLEDCRSHRDLCQRYVDSLPRWTPRPDGGERYELRTGSPQ